MSLFRKNLVFPKSQHHNIKPFLVGIFQQNKKECGSYLSGYVVYLVVCQVKDLRLRFFNFKLIDVLGIEFSPLLPAWIIFKLLPLRDC